jgi:hypothetical protein
MKLPQKRIWFGSEEVIFDRLPANVLANFRNARSENALLWNTIYKIAQPTIPLKRLLAIQPLWGTRSHFEEPDDRLIPYFWGFNIEGDRLNGLDHAVNEVDGPGPGTEMDLILVGENHLIAVEAKHTNGFGRCSRYLQGRCPEIHPGNATGGSCRYWDEGASQFARDLRIGDRPDISTEAPVCSHHYQLSRTLLLGQYLAMYHSLIFSFWAIVSKSKWRSLELDWLDFADRVRDSSIWRRMRVLHWDGLLKLDRG